MFTKITDWIIGLLVRFVLATSAIVLALAFVLYSWCYEKRLNLEPLEGKVKRNSLLWGIIDLALLLILLRLLAGCVRPIPETVAPNTVGAPVIVEISNATQSQGMTDCRHDTIIVFIRADVALTLNAVSIFSHEATHAHDMRGWDCNEYLKRYKSDPKFRLEMETHAYCVQAKVAVLVLDANFEEYFDSAVTYLTDGTYNLGLSREDIKTYFLAHCKSP